MMVDLLTLPASGLAVLIGYSAHRAGVCTVRAAAEIVTTRRANMLASFLKAATWAMIVAVPAAWLLDVRGPATFAFEPTLVGAAGGLLFGVGAALNGACAVSTVSRLGSGDLGMLATLLGMTLGYAGAATSGFEPEHVVAAPVLGQPAPWSIGIVSVAAVWGLVEAVRLWHTRQPDVWRLSTAAVWIGMGNAALGLLAGSWAYMGLARAVVRWVHGDGPPPADVRWVLFAALLAGAVLSAVRNRSFRWRVRPRAAWFLHLAGGALMGAGASVIPGGNDAVLLQALPAFAPHAAPAYAGILSGALLAVALMRAWGASLRPIDCSGDVCRER